MSSLRDKAHWVRCKLHVHRWRPERDYQGRWYRECRDCSTVRWDVDVPTWCPARRRLHRRRPFLRPPARPSRPAARGGGGHGVDALLLARPTPIGKRPGRPGVIVTHHAPIPRRPDPPRAGRRLRLLLALLLPAPGEELSRVLGMLAGVGRPVRVAQPLLELGRPLVQLDRPLVGGQLPAAWPGPLVGVR
jgi:hypothetical protein